MEAKESIQTFRWVATLLVQIATVLATANVVVVGYAATNAKAVFFIPGVGITTVLLIAYRGGIKVAVPLLCRFTALEEKFKTILHMHLETGITTLTLLHLNRWSVYRERSFMQKVIFQRFPVCALKYGTKTDVLRGCMKEI